MTTPDILALMKELKKLVIAVEKISEVLCKPTALVRREAMHEWVVEEREKRKNAKKR